MDGGSPMKLCLACGRVYEEGASRCPTDGDELLPYEASRPAGEVVEGGYRVVRLVGVGQCGEVFECQTLATGKRAVLRLMAPELTGNRITTELLLRHMMQLREFDHPNVVRVHDVALHEGRLALVRDWVEGERLLDVLLREGALSVPHALDVAIQLSKTLEAAHKVDLLHLQLRPSNVFLEVGQGSTLEQARLVDFGIGPQRMVDGRDVYGTIRTLSPEQIEGWDPSPRSDLYSLGLLIHRMITGRQPFAGTGDDVVRQSLEAQLPPLTGPSGRRSPAPLEELVRAMAAKRPGDRPRHATEVLVRLRTIQQEVEDDLAFELAFREEPQDASRASSFRELQTVIVRRASIAPPPPPGAAAPPAPPPQELLTPQGAERKRRESLPPGVQALPVAPAEPPRREAQTVMWLKRAESDMRLSSARAEAVELPDGMPTTDQRATPIAVAAPPAPAAGRAPGGPKPAPLATAKPPGVFASSAAAAAKPVGGPRPAAAVPGRTPGRKGQATLVGLPAVSAARRPALAPAPPSGPTTDYEDLSSAAFLSEPPLAESSPTAPDDAPVTLDPIPISDSIPTGIPVDVVDHAEQVEAVVGSRSAPSLPPISPEPPAVAFGFEPGAVLPDLLPPAVQAPTPRRWPWIAAAVGVAVAASVVLWLAVFRDTGGSTPAGAGSPASAPDAGTVVAAAAPDAADRAAADGGSKQAEVADVKVEASAADVAPPAPDVAAAPDAAPDAPADIAEAAPDVEEAAAAEAAVAEVAVAEDVPEPPELSPSGPNEEQVRASKHWSGLGYEQLASRQFAQARASFERALRFDPRNRQARIGLGRVAFQQGRFAEVIDHLQPFYRARGNMLLGIAYVRVGRNSDARSQFEKILEHDPDNADARRALLSLPR